MNDKKQIIPDDATDSSTDGGVNVDTAVDKVPAATAKTSDIQSANSFNKLNLFNDKDLVAAENFLTKIMRSEKGGIKSVNDGLAVLMRAQDLQLPFSSCLEHIHVINGKTGIDIHIIKALLLRAGCTWTCEKDYQPLYEYTDGNNVYIDDSLPDYAIKCSSHKEAEACHRNHYGGILNHRPLAGGFSQHGHIGLFLHPVFGKNEKNHGDIQ